MTVVIDASAAVSVVTNEPNSECFKSWIYANELIAAPDLLYANISNALTKGVRTRRFRSTEVEAYMHDAIGLVDKFYRLDDLTSEVAIKSLKYCHSSYDMYYMVLAQRLGATVLTLDKHLAKLCLKNDIDCICGMDIEVDGGTQDWLVRTEFEDYDPSVHLKN